MLAGARVVLMHVLVRIASYDLNAERSYLTLAFITLQPKEKYELLEQLLVQCKDLPGAKDRTVKYALIVWSLHSNPFNLGDDNIAFFGLIGRLEVVANADVQVAATELKKRLERTKKPGAPSPKETDVFLPLRELALVRDSDDRPVDDLSGILTIGPKLDVL